MSALIPQYNNDAFDVCMPIIITGITIGFDTASYIVNEVDRYVILSIVLLNNITEPHNATFSVTGGSASFNDFVDPGEMLLQFNEGATNFFQVNISVIGDFLLEDTEEFFGILQSSDFAVEFQNNVSTISIEDGDCKS